MAWKHRRLTVDVIIGLAVILGDRTVKYLALYWLIPGIPLKAWSFFGVDLFWTLTYNQGAAWGACEGSPRLLLFFRVFFIAILCGVYLMSRMTPLSRTALAVILAGACSNIIDTIVWGHVVDMIHFQFWGWDYPVFNVADMSICIGSGTIFVLMLFSPSKESLS
jgi:signal peptidase II